MRITKHHINKERTTTTSGSSRWRGQAAPAGGSGRPSKGQRSERDRSNPRKPKHRARGDGVLAAWAGLQLLWCGQPFSTRPSGTVDVLAERGKHARNRQGPPPSSWEAPPLAGSASKLPTQGGRCDPPAGGAGAPVQLKPCRLRRRCCGLWKRSWPPGAAVTS